MTMKPAGPDDPAYDEAMFYAELDAQERAEVDELRTLTIRQQFERWRLAFWRRIHPCAVGFLDYAHDWQWIATEDGMDCVCEVCGEPLTGPEEYPW